MEQRHGYKDDDDDEATKIKYIEMNTKCNTHTQGERERHKEAHNFYASYSLRCHITLWVALSCNFPFIQTIFIEFSR